MAELKLVGAVTSVLYKEFVINATNTLPAKFIVTYPLKNVEEIHGM